MLSNSDSAVVSLALNEELSAVNEPLIEAPAVEPNPLFHIPFVIVFEPNIEFIVENVSL